jgi:hypothetical protein
LRRSSGNCWISSSNYGLSHIPSQCQHWNKPGGRRKFRFAYCYSAKLGVACPLPQKDIPKKEYRMATRQIKMPVKETSEQEVEDVFSQRKRPERGRFLLQVDRQTKGSYTTAEAAQAAALIIKKNYPIVQVSVYDSVDNSNTLVEASPASS